MCRTRSCSDYIEERYVTVVSTYWWCHGSTTNDVTFYNGPDQLVPSPGGPVIRHGLRLLHLRLDYHLDEQGVAAAQERLVRHARTCPQGAPCGHLAHDLDVLYRDREGIVGGEPIVPQLAPTPQA
jgi:hypothetical protein